MGAQGSLSTAGFNFLKKQEGYRNVAYTLKGEGYPTVGFGHHSRDLVNGKYYTDEQCMAFFKADSVNFTRDVNKVWNSEMSQSMFDAMFSFAYNTGHISGTALGNTIKRDWKNKSKVVSTWMASKVVGQYKAVLQRRRKDESTFFYGQDSVSQTIDKVFSETSTELSNAATNGTNVSSSVISDSGDNIYSSLSTSDGTDASVHHTRIYKSINPTIQVDELSLPMDGMLDNVDMSTGQHTSDSSVVDASANTKDSETKTNENSTQTKDSDSNEQRVNKPSLKNQLGVAYPIIRINDHYFGSSEIEYFEIDTSGFIPTVSLELRTQNNDLQKTNTIKEGDKMSVFVSSGNGLIKSLRCDFLITCFEAPEQSQTKINYDNTYRIYGELFVPNLYNQNMTFSFAGTSREALEDVAQKLGLGFFFCDEDNTDDSQMWYCMPDNDNANNPSMIRNYIQEVASHAWKAFDAFYDCWIDPRYGLSFININKMLGEEGLDETFDVTMFKATFDNQTKATVSESNASETETKNDPRLQIKMINNLSQDEDSTTPFFALSFKEVNQTNEITQQIGVYNQSSYTIDNQGVDTDNNTYEMSISIPYNQTKLDNGFYILVGPGQNVSYNQADNGSYTDQNTVKTGGKTSDVQADSDGDTIKSSGNNKMATGNVNKFYDSAYDHNRINNLFLQKKYVVVELRGLNLGIMRGEKIPTLFIDNNKFNSLMNGTDDTKPDNTRLSQYLNDCTFTNLSGWFVIDAITWQYNGNAGNGMTPWTTRVKLIRREWPRPGYTTLVSNKQDASTAVNTITIEDNVDTSTNTSDYVDTTHVDEVESDSEIPLSGLKDFMKDIYLAIKDAADGNVKLVGARRYAVDEDGNRVDGNAFVSTANGYKCMDARGNILYFKSNNSRHLYGEAIDIVNSGSLSFDDLLTKVIGVNSQILYMMFQKGVSLYIETSKDDNGTKTKHYHIGTDTLKQKQFWETVVYNLNNNCRTIDTGNTKFNIFSYSAYNNSAEAEYQSESTIEEY